MIVFLDVDGCLNADPSSRYVTVKVGPYPVHYRPRVIEWLNDLRSNWGAELVWATTWALPGGDRDLAELQDALGLRPRTPLFAPGSRYAWQRDWWKVRTIAAFLEANPGRPWVWLDDDIDDNVGRWLTATYAAGLTIRTDPRVGISDEDMARVDEHIQRAETAEILDDPETVESIEEGLAALKAAQLHSADEVAAMLAARRAEGEEAADLTARANAAIEHSGQDDESAMFMLEANRRLWLDSAADFDAAAPTGGMPDDEGASTTAERHRLVDKVLDERYREVLDRLGREDGPLEP